MRKINYPEGNEFVDFQNSYYNQIISSGLVDENKINNYLKSIPYDGNVLNLKRLLTEPFDKLHLVFQEIEGNLSPTRIKNLSKLFQYGDCQPWIARFFSGQEGLNLDSCFFCNMDYIYPFIDIGDYKDGIQFVNHAYQYELEKVKEIGPTTAKNIIKHRPYNDLNEVAFRRTISKQLLEGFQFQYTHSHFTLDHVLPQKTYKLLSLCLFNFVPSCFSCNSKFKKAKNFNSIQHAKISSPSSAMFSINKDFRFSLLYDGGLDDLEKGVNFQLYQDIFRNNSAVIRYFEIFKIPARYSFHKNEVVRLIEKKKKYPRSKILDIADLLSYEEEEIRNSVYGVELFDNEYMDSPLVKFKRDIAKTIYIKDVLP